MQLRKMIKEVLLEGHPVTHSYSFPIIDEIDYAYVIMFGKSNFK